MILELIFRLERYTKREKNKVVPRKYFVLRNISFFIVRRKKMKKKFCITTAIAYASGKPHIGNTYEIILADALARYKRLDGYDVYFQTGTDEHGEKIELKAKENGVDPKTYVDQISNEVRHIFDCVGATYDCFVRTTDLDHKNMVQIIFQKLYDQGDIYKDYYEGWYCTPCESFFTETQLVDGKCPDCGRDVHLTKEEAYFFRISKYQNRLISYIEEHPEFIQPESRKNEMIRNFLSVGLNDLCVSRTSFSWGIPVPFDRKHVIYVWIDALANYITKLGYDPLSSSDRFQYYWPADLQLVGKDIIRFHTIYWPILLMALGLPLPKKVFGHPWLLANGDKMSKSKGNVIYADELVKEFGMDAVRFYVLHEVPYLNDGSISKELMIERINSDLANIYGNLVHRTNTMVFKYFDGKVSHVTLTNELLLRFNNEVLGLKSKLDLLIEEVRIGDFIDAIFGILRDANKLIDDMAPWTLYKNENFDLLHEVLYVLLDSIRICSTLLLPIIPHASKKALMQMGVSSFDFANLFDTMDYTLDESEVLFQRIDCQ